jgi:hypothetical protein
MGPPGSPLISMGSIGWSKTNSTMAVTGTNSSPSNGSLETSFGASLAPVPSPVVKLPE